VRCSSKSSKRQPDIQPVLDAVIEAGGDIEITAHNQGDISFALANPSGIRHILLADARLLLQSGLERPLEAYKETAPE
jgi:hypothetical protein